MKSGLKKVRPDHRDYDFLKSHKHLFGDAGLGPDSTTGLPDSFNVDAGLTMPDQDAVNDQYNPPIPALPFGCTDYTQTDLCIDEDGVLYNPQLMEDYTHADANGGYDIRKSLDATRKVFGRSSYFNIRSSGIIDAFDAIRLAMYSALPEKRSVSIGVPWFPEFETPLPLSRTLPVPLNFTTSGVPWHNAKVAGWTSVFGTPYLIVKSWQGPNYGDKGYCYMSRELVNILMSISGTGAFTLSKVASPQIMTVDLTVVERIVSYVLNLLAALKSPTNYSTMPNPQNAPPPIVPQQTTTEPPTPVTPAPAQVPSQPAGLLWNTIENARHSLRVICDDEGLSVDDKNTLCATVAEESGFMSYYLSGPKKGMPVRRENFLKDGTLWSTDWGICQWNDHYHATEITPREALDNPEKAIRLMCSYWKRGEASKRQWVAYKTGAYQKHL